MQQKTKKSITRILLYSAVFSFLIFFFTLQFAVVNLLKDLPADYFANLKLNFVQYFPWLFLAFFVMACARKYPFYQKKWFAFILFHILAGIFFSILAGLISYLAYYFLYDVATGDFIEYLIIMLSKSINFNILVYVAIVGFGQMWDYYRKKKESEVRTSQLEASLAQSKLDILRIQLNPHFIFNTMHNILALVRKNPEAAESMLLKLCDLLRKTFATSDLREIPLKEELEFIKIYLDIQKARFKERLQVEFDIDPQAQNILIPSLILQPIVENAIKHGIEAVAAGGTITVEARIKGSELRLQVKDTGPGIKMKRALLFEQGFGLKNTRIRLNSLYDKEDPVIISNGADGGTVFTIYIPVKKAVE